MINFTAQEVGFLVIMWFITGRQFGHISAKYARAKKSSRILASIFLFIAVVSTFIIFSKEKLVWLQFLY